MSLRPTAGGLAALALKRIDTAASPTAKRRRAPATALRETRQAVAVRDRTRHLAAALDTWRRYHPAQGLDLWTARGLDAADVIEHLASRHGPYDLTACTFAIGEASLRRLAVLRDRGALERVSLLCDPLMFSSARNAPAAAVRQLADVLAVGPCHAKVYCLTGPAHRAAATPYVLTGSANLTTNPRLEVIHLSAAPDLVGFYFTQLTELMASVNHAQEAKAAKAQARRERRSA
ncbi:MAG: hypothetical protein K2Y37_14810 [Pirellulales bacterium]|nr:hypothetical protein [Pirellulales bacterium]